MMTIWNVCFIVGASAGMVGMALGIDMGISQDFSLTPVHAHLNLLGWVSMMLYGLYYRGLAGPVGALAWVQVVAATGGFVAMTGGLWLAFTGNPDMGKPIAAVGACLSISSILLFAMLLVDEGLRSRRESGQMVEPD
jgi:hypothetical protein